MFSLGKMRFNSAMSLLHTSVITLSVIRTESTNPLNKIAQSAAVAPVMFRLVLRITTGVSYQSIVLINSANSAVTLLPVISNFASANCPLLRTTSRFNGQG